MHGRFDGSAIERPDKFQSDRKILITDLRLADFAKFLRVELVNLVVKSSLTHNYLNPSYVLYINDICVA